MEATAPKKESEECPTTKRRGEFEEKEGVDEKVRV